MHIIGIQILSGESHILKNLKPGWYPFCSYNSSNSEPPKPKESLKFDVNYNFYKLVSETNKKISVSCIVGKNGSGKSTLLEMLYRIINNVGFIFKYINDYNGCDLTYESGFKAKLYYSIFFDDSEKVGCIEINNDEENYITFPNGKSFCLGQVIYNDDENADFPYTLYGYDKTISLKEFENLFYSVVTNYSMYAFNPNDYNENYYPYGIFHKNDAYITPIVLLPYRNKEGAIDIENERGLAKQRIIALQIFLYKKYKTSFVENRIPLKISYQFTYKDEATKFNYSVIKEKLDQLNRILKQRYNKTIIKKKIKTGEPWADSDYNNYYKELSASWKEKFYTDYGIDINKTIYNSEIKERLLFYLVYKTLKVCVNYELFLDKFDFSSPKTAFKLIIDEIAKDKTFITLKIRQCIEFIKYPLPVNEGINKTNYLNISDFDTDGKTIDDYFLHLPPSIFDTDLIFSDVESSDAEIKLSALSSGETQLLNSFSYVLYHLKNLECDKTELSENSEVNYPDYKNILIIFDEAELYMHPEYQRQFLFKLITAIYNCHFKHIKQIQILIATHSPYILSDVPVQNLLVLENGEKKLNKLHEQTFGANIYDLLKNQFFMSAPIGEIANRKINEIIEDANSSEFSVNDNKLEAHLDFVRKLGDSYLRNTLEYMLLKLKRRGTD